MENINNKNKRMFVNVKTRKSTSVNNDITIEEYDRNGNLLRRQNSSIFNDSISEIIYEYDNNNNCIHELRRDNNNIIFECWTEYNENNLVKHYKELYGNEYECLYDELNRLKLKLYKDKSSIMYMYDKNNNIIEKYCYYNDTYHSNPEDKKDKAIEYHYKYDKNNNLIHVKTINSKNGIIIEDTSYVYDKHGDRIMIIFDDKSIVYYKYNKRGNCLFTKTKNNDGSKSWIKYKYDKNNNMILSQDSHNDINKYKYCKYGICECIKTSYRFKLEHSRYKYDKYGHLIEKINMLNNRIEEKYKYDKFGNIIYQEDSIGYYANIEYEYFK